MSNIEKGTHIELSNCSEIYNELYYGWGKFQWCVATEDWEQDIFVRYDMYKHNNNYFFWEKLKNLFSGSLLTREQYVEKHKEDKPPCSSEYKKYLHHYSEWWRIEKRFVDLESILAHNIRHGDPVYLSLSDYRFIQKWYDVSDEKNDGVNIGKVYRDLLYNSWIY